MTSARESGMTLIELMVVVAVIGIVTTAATLALSNDRDVNDSATALAGRVRECARLAAMSGPIRADVVAAGTTARARLAISPSDDGGQTITLERMVEDELPAETGTWSRVSQTLTGAGVRVVATSLDAPLGGGEDPDEMLGEDTLQIQCYPDGTVDGLTVFLEEIEDGGDKARVAILPLNGEAVVGKGW